MLGFTARTETIVRAAPDVVFAIVADVSRHNELAGSGEVLTVRVLTPDPTRVGTRFEAEEDIKVGPQRQRFVAASEIVDYDPPRAISWIPRPPQKPQPRRIQWWFRLTAEPGGTCVVHEAEVDFGPVANILMKVPYALMRGKTVRRGMERTLANLKEQAESRAAAAV